MRDDTAKHYREIRRILRGNPPEVDDYKPRDKALTWLIIILGIMVVLALFSGCGYTATIDQWADSVRITEGVHSKYAYGIRSIKYKNDLQARKICKNTVLHAWRDFKGCKTDLRAFIAYLGDRYCPKSADYVGNLRWKRNMYKLMTKRG
jgi:hypothetical protein